MPENLSERMIHLGSVLKFARESKMGPKNALAFSTQIGYSHATIRAVESNNNRPSRELVEKYKDLDALPCRRTTCEGRTECDLCTVGVIVRGLEFNITRTNQSAKDRGSFLDNTTINSIINELGLNPEQIEEARKRIFRSSLEILLEIANESEADQKPPVS